MSMLEINPLIVTEDKRLHCLDAKISFDGNALYRHPDVMELRDETEEDAKEIEAAKYDLSYVAHKLQKLLPPWHVWPHEPYRN